MCRRYPRALSPREADDDDDDDDDYDDNTCDSFGRPKFCDKLGLEKLGISGFSIHIRICCKLQIKCCKSIAVHV